MAAGDISTQVMSQVSPIRVMTPWVDPQSNAVVAMKTRPRVLIDVSPRMFATALARILAERGYAVDVGGQPDHHDLAVLTEDSEGAHTAIEIVLPSLEDSRVTARITSARGSRRAEVRNLDDLLVLIAAELSRNAGVAGLPGVVSP